MSVPEWMWAVVWPGQWSPVVKSLATGVGVLFLTQHVFRRIKRARLRREWDSVGKDVVLLHQFKRGKYCPNLSPFALKVELFLRLANINYQVDSKSPFGPKGKCPWITLNGEDVADSEFILDHLTQHFGVNLEAGVERERVGAMEAVRVLADEHFFWCVVSWRYWLDKCNIFLTTQSLGTINHIFMPIFMTPGIAHRAKGQGIGIHSSEEIFVICRKDCATLAAVLGDADFFGGAVPRRVDCAVFGQLAQLMWNAPGTRYQHLLTVQFPSLGRYCQRMKERVFPDWQDLLIAQ